MPYQEVCFWNLLSAVKYVPVNLLFLLVLRSALFLSEAIEVQFLVSNLIHLNYDIPSYAVQMGSVNKEYAVEGSSPV